MWKASVMIALSMSASGVMAGDYSAYLGVWQTEVNTRKVAEIRKDGDTYLYDDLRDYGMSGDKKKGPLVLSPSGDQLVLKTPFGSAPLALSGDKNTVYFDQWVFKRVPGRDADLVKIQIVAEITARKSNREKCEALGKEFDAKRDAVYKSSAPGKDKLAKSAELKKELTARAEPIPECNRQLMNY